MGDQISEVDCAVYGQLVQMVYTPESIPGNRLIKGTCILKTYVAFSHVHLSLVWKQVKLSGSCLSTFYGFGSTQLSDILISYRVLTFSWQNKVIKECPKYLFAFYQN